MFIFHRQVEVLATHQEGVASRMTGLLLSRWNDHDILDRHHNRQRFGAEPCLEFADFSFLVLVI